MKARAVIVGARIKRKKLLPKDAPIPPNKTFFLFPPHLYFIT